MKELLYYVVDTSLWIPMRSYLKRVYFDGLENFPEGKPVFLACNHPNSFLDGVIFEDLFRRPIYTLVRGDVFLNPVANQALRGLRLLPIFRSRDTDEKTQKKGNAQTLEDCHKILKRNRAVLIFSEGIAKPEKNVRKVMTGTARMSIKLAQRNDFEMDLQVVPVGLNYEHFGEQQTRVHLSFGKPIAMRDYRQRIESDDEGLANEITDKIRENFEEKVVLNPERDEIIDYAEHLAMNHCWEPFKLRVRGSGLNKAIPQINSMDSSLRADIQTYKTELDKHKITDQNVMEGFYDFLTMFVAIGSAIISLPAFLVSKLLSVTAYKIVKKKITNRVFTDSIYVGVNMIFHWIWYAALLTICLVQLSPFWAVGCFVFTVYATHCWYQFSNQWSAMWKETKYLMLPDSTRQELIHQRKSIIDRLFNQ